MTIERAVDAQALRVVKYVLLVEKVPEKDPRYVLWYFAPADLARCHSS